MQNQKPERPLERATSRWRNAYIFTGLPLTVYGLTQAIRAEHLFLTRGIGLGPQNPSVRGVDVFTSRMISNPELRQRWFQNRASPLAVVLGRLRRHSYKHFAYGLAMGASPLAAEKISESLERISERETAQRWIRNAAGSAKMTPEKWLGILNKGFLGAALAKELNDYAMASKIVRLNEGHPKIQSAYKRAASRAFSPMQLGLGLLGAGTALTAVWAVHKWKTRGKTS